MSSSLVISCALLAISMAVPGLAYVPVTANMRTFSSAIKDGKLVAKTEKVLYEHSTGQPGVITEQWFTGKYAMNSNTTIRIYVDWEETASLDFQLLLAHGIGFNETLEKPYIPWGTRRIAHAADGGIYNTFRIPFSKSVRVTATHPVGGGFWYIIRGVENYPLILGDLQLPSTTRLKLYKNVGVQLVPLQFLPLANVSNSAGAVFMVTLAGNSTDYNYLEACFRVRIDGAKDYMWLSSGTEDFFLSAYYFDKGAYHLDNAGMTYKDGAGLMSAYKFFENDPLLFTKSLELVWRCGETVRVANGCPTTFPWNPSTGEHGEEYTAPKLANTTVTSYVWVYEWQNT